MAQPIAVIRSKPDTLGPEVRRFAQAPLRRTAFLNSVPKCGTHLLRNIVRMFVPIQQHYDREFLQMPNFDQHRGALDPMRPTFSCGHMLYADAPALALRHAHHVILVRDPFDYVLARARFAFSDEFRHPGLEALKAGASVEQMINFMIFGIPAKGPAVREVFTFHAVAWMGTGAHLVRYEDIVAHLKDLEAAAAETYFRDLLAKFGIALPDDWRDRVRVGSAREHSATSREKLSVGMTLPEALPDDQKRAVDFMAPGLRELLGYG
jgi:hypothetical protein